MEIKSRITNRFGLNHLEAVHLDKLSKPHKKEMLKLIKAAKKNKVSQALDKYGFHSLYQ